MEKLEDIDAELFERQQNFIKFLVFAVIVLACLVDIFVTRL